MVGVLPLIILQAYCLPAAHGGGRREGLDRLRFFPLDEAVPQIWTPRSLRLITDTLRVVLDSPLSPEAIDEVVWRDVLVGTLGMVVHLADPNVVRSASPVAPVTAAYAETSLLPLTLEEVIQWGANPGGVHLVENLARFPGLAARSHPLVRYTGRDIQSALEPFVLRHLGMFHCSLPPVIC